MRTVPGALVVVLCAASVRAEEALTVDRSATLTTKQGDGVFFVEGRLTIPRGVHVSCQRGTRVVGRGEGAVLVVEGSFSVVGTREERCAVEGLAIELAPGFKNVRFAETELVEACSIRTAEGLPAAGILQLETCQVPRQAVFEVELTEGELHFLETSVACPVKITGLPVPVGERLTDNRTSVLASGGSFAAFDMAGVSKSRLRHTKLRGEVTLANCGDLMLDGCRLDGPKVAVTHTEPGGLKDTRFTKCDFYLEELSFSAPGSKRSTVTIDKPYFECCSDADALDKVVRDGADDATNGAVADVKKQRGERNGFADG